MAQVGLHDLWSAGGGAYYGQDIYATPEQFGAARNGVTDDTAAFNLALLSGKPVKLLEGTYFLNGPVNWRNYIDMIGAGSMLTTLLINGGVSGIVVNSVSDCTLEGFRISNVNNMPGGSIGLTITASINIELKDIRITRQNIGLYASGNSRLIMDRVFLYANNLAAYGPYDGEGAAFWSFGVYLNKLFVSGNASGLIANNWADVYINDSDFVSNVGMGAAFESDNVGATYVQDLKITNSLFDSNGNIGLRVYKRDFVGINNSWVSSGRTAGVSGLFMLACRNVHLNNFQAVNCGLDGMSIQTVTPIQFSNVISKANTRYGCYVELVAGDLVQMSNCDFGGTIVGGLFTQVNGLVLGGDGGAVHLSNVQALLNSGEQFIASGAVNGIVFDIKSCNFGLPASWPFFGKNSNSFLISQNRREYFDAAAPGAGTWAVGDRCWKNNPASLGSPGWICTTAPLTFSAMANLA